MFIITFASFSKLDLDMKLWRHDLRVIQLFAQFVRQFTLQDAWLRRIQLTFCFKCVTQLHRQFQQIAPLHINQSREQNNNHCVHTKWGLKDMYTTPTEKLEFIKTNLTRESCNCRESLTHTYEHFGGSENWRCRIWSSRLIPNVTMTLSFPYHSIWNDKHLSILKDTATLCLQSPYQTSPHL